MRLDDLLVEHEAVLDAGVEAGAADAAPAEAPGAVQDGATEAAPEPPIEADATPAWAPTQDDWQNLQSELAQLRQAVTPQEPTAAAPALSDYADAEGIITPDALQRYIAEEVQRGVQAQMEPVRPVLDQTIQERGEQMVRAEFDRLKSTVGDFDPDLARAIAEGLVHQTNDPAAALTQAAQLAHNALKAARETAVEEYKQTLANIGNAPTEPGAAGAGVLDETKPKDYNDATARWLARHGIQP